MQIKGLSLKKALKKALNMENNLIFFHSRLIKRLIKRFVKRSPSGENTAYFQGVDDNQRIAEAADVELRPVEVARLGAFLPHTDSRYLTGHHIHCVRNDGA
ncbi:MAG: hypothetical protein LBJ47_08730 [Tannerella sp.]|jgi:hypothetical protein|nr:hypothetical protein [Tannerella sp.]